jgi:hypothetical protein
MVYAFYDPIPEITYVNKWRCYEFKCAARGCKYKSRRYLDTKDRASMGNLVKHAKLCWGEEAWSAAEQCGSAADARSKVTGPIKSSGSITASFRRRGNGNISYSHQMHTKTETKSVTYLPISGASDNNTS